MSFSEVCESLWVWLLILFYGRANGKWLALFQFLLATYTIGDFGKPIALLAAYFNAGFLLGVFFHPEDGGDKFLRQVS
jgi:hypothetical protein